MELNVTSISFIFEAILLASLLAVVFAQASMRLACRLGLMDQPLSAPHKKHSRATPLAGGLALAGALLVSELFFNTFQDRSVAAVFLAGGLVFIFGLWDDFKGISPAIKFLGQALATLVLIIMGVSIKILESPEFFFGGSGPLIVYLDWLLTFLWVIGITNAFNFVDSMDGLSVGLGGLAAAFFMLVTLDAGQPLLSRHSALVLGACIGLYFFNSRRPSFSLVIQALRRWVSSWLPWPSPTGHWEPTSHLPGWCRSCSWASRSLIWRWWSCRACAGAVRYTSLRWTIPTTDCCLSVGTPTGRYCLCISCLCYWVAWPLYS